MSRCLTPDEFVDLVDGTLGPDRRAHVTTCATCRRSLADVQEALRMAGTRHVPEPPPAFWPSINARVNAAITDVDVTPGWQTWLRWPVVVPVAGVAVVVVALASAVDRAAPGRPGAPIAAGALATATDADPPDGPLDDDALALVEDLAASLPEGGWDALGITRLPDLDVAAAALSADEQAALAALLQAAVERPKS